MVGQYTEAVGQTDLGSTFLPRLNTRMLFRHTSRTFVAIVIAAMLASIAVVWSPTTTPPAFAAGLSDPGALTVHEGSMTVTESGAVIENLEIRGTLRIEASNVTVRNVWVYTSSPWTVYVASGSLNISNSEIGHPSVVGERGIGGSNVVASGLDIHSVEDGIKLGANARYSGVVVHNLNSPSSDGHLDAVQADGGAKNSSITNSVLSSLGPKGLGNAAVFLKSDLGPISNVTISGNYLNGGNYMNAVRDGGYGVPSGIKFTNNRIGDDYRYGITRFDGGTEWSGNVWDESGLPANAGDGQGGGSGGGTETSTTSAPTTTKPPPPAPTTTKPATGNNGGGTGTSDTTPTTLADDAPPGPESPELSEGEFTTTSLEDTTTSTTAEILAAPATPTPPPPSSRGWLVLAVLVAVLAIGLLGLAGVREYQFRREPQPELY